MIATMSSMSSASRIKRKLSEFGIFSSVIQTPHILAKEGCGYSLRFDENSKSIVLSTAEELGIKIHATYTESEKNGKKEYTKIPL